MIDELDVNHKVGSIYIKLIQDNPINTEILKTMTRRYQNAYNVGIKDYSDNIDNDVHSQLMQMVDNSKLLVFGLYFYRRLKDNEDGFRLVKQYNKLMQQKTHLENLWYCHQRIDVHGQSSREIKSIINQVKHME